LELEACQEIYASRRNKDIRVDEPACKSLASVDIPLAAIAVFVFIAFNKETGIEVSG